MQEHSATDKEIARRIRIQMAGGYDVQRVINDSFAAKTRPGVKERRAIADAKAEVGRVQSRFSALAADEDRLVELEDQQRSAKKAERELKMLGDAIELAGLRKIGDNLDEELASFPSSLDCFTGDEIDYVDQQESDLDGCESAIKALELEVAETITRIRLARFDAQRPTSSDLSSWMMRVSDLRDQERNLRGAREKDDQAKAALASAEFILGGKDHAGSAPDLSFEAIDQVAAFVKRCDDLDGRGAALRGRLEALESTASPEDRDTLIRGAGVLREWLSAPQTAHIKIPAWLLAGCAVMSALAVVLAYFLAPLWIGLAGLGAGVLLVVFFLSTIGQDAGAELLRLARQFEGSGLGKPESWSRKDVSLLLVDLDQRIMKANLAEEQTAQRTMVQSQLEQLQREKLEHESARVELQSGVGVQMVSDLSLADLVYRYRAVHDASRALAEASTLVDNITTQCSRTIKDACAFLEPFGYEISTDAAGLEADLVGLKDRLAEYDNGVALRKSATSLL